MSDNHDQAHRTSVQTQTLFPAAPAPLPGLNPDTVHDPIPVTQQQSEYHPEYHPVKVLFGPASRPPTGTMTSGPVILNLPGLHIRHRLTPTMDDLRALSPDSQESSLRSAITDLGLVDADTFSIETAQQTGVAYQKSFGIVSEDIGRLTSGSSNYTLALACMGALLKLIRSFDPEPQPRHGIWHSFTSAVAGESEPMDEISRLRRTSADDRRATIRRNANNLRGLLESGMVRELLDNAGALTTQLDYILVILDSYVVQCMFLQRLFGSGPAPPKPECAEALGARMESLHTTWLVARQARQHLEQMKTGWKQFEAGVLDAVCNLIPAWNIGLSGGQTANRASMELRDQIVRTLSAH